MFLSFLQVRFSGPKFKHQELINMNSIHPVTKADYFNTFKRHFLLLLETHNERIFW